MSRTSAKKHRCQERYMRLMIIKFLTDFFPLPSMLLRPFINPILGKTLSEPMNLFTCTRSPILSFMLQPNQCNRNPYRMSANIEIKLINNSGSYNYLAPDSHQINSLSARGNKSSGIQINLSKSQNEKSEEKQHFLKVHLLATTKFNYFLRR